MKPEQRGEIRLFLSNVPFKATTDQISAFASEVGTVLSITTPRDPETRLRRGYVFVSIKLPEDKPDDHWKLLDGKFMEYPGPEHTLRRIVVKLATRRREIRSKDGFQG